MKSLTTSDVVAILKKRQGKRSLRALAKELKISAAYLSDIYLGKREPGDKVLTQLKLTKRETRLVCYEKAQ